jgi:hypothetical protein
MQKLHIKQTPNTPELKFSPNENIFLIRGTSSPEDVRALYYPVIEWVRKFVNDVLAREYEIYNNKTPIDFQIDLAYFNSSSAKFLFDIFQELKKIPSDICPVAVKWHYDEEDVDMKEAGKDMASFVEMEFNYISKPKTDR